MGRLVLGCEHVQGYPCGPPGPPEDLEALLASQAGNTWRSDDSADAEGSRYRPERVLIIDDTADVRMLANMSLAAVGFEVHEAESGRAGLAAARQCSPDCILLDMRMPDMNGLDVCRALRADEATANCTIVMLTANADSDHKIQAFEAGADDYIIKPFSLRELGGRVRAAMGRRSGSS